MSELLFDRGGRRRSPATMPGFHAGRLPRNKGLRYPADPPTVEQIVAVMRAADGGPHGCRLRGVIVVLWRAGLRIQEAPALSEADLDRRRGALLVRRGKGGRRREVGMDEWAWEQVQPWPRPPHSWHGTLTEIVSWAEECCPPSLPEEASVGPRGRTVPFAAYPGELAPQSIPFASIVRCLAAMVARRRNTASSAGTVGHRASETDGTPLPARGGRRRIDAG
jgi:hypothetical protein